MIKEFSADLVKLKSYFYDANAGEYKDQQVDLEFKFSVIEKGFLMFKIKFNDHPQVFPFCVIIEIQIQDQKELFFYDKGSNDKKCSSFQTKFHRKTLFKDSVTIKYKLSQVPPFVCTLSNNLSLCYLNSVIQLLVHLKKFRTFINSVTKTENQSDIPYYIKRMNRLFDRMMSGKETESTDELALSFGWSKMALQIQKDASEFLLRLLENIRQNTPKDKIEKFDTIFTSHFTNNEAQIMLQVHTFTEKSIHDTISKYLTCDDGLIKKFTHFPEILLIQVKGQYKNFENSIDLSPFSDGTTTHSKYTLCGFIIHVGASTNSGHYKCIVRSNYENIWYYFNDSVQGVYSTLDKDGDIQRCMGAIASKGKEQEKIRVVMYVADDVLNEYFDPKETFVPLRDTHFKGNDSENSQIKKTNFYIITNKNISDHVEGGHTDFKEMNEKDFEMIRLGVNENVSEVYKTVAKRFGVELNSFVLRSTQQNAPTINIFPNMESPLPKAVRDYVLYFEKLDEKEEEMVKLDEISVPFFFLHYEFNPKKFLRNLESNLNHSHRSVTKKQITSVKPFRLNKFKLGFLGIKMKKQHDDDDDEYDEQSNSDDEHELDQSLSVEELIDRNNFKYITQISLRPTDKFSMVKQRLLKELKKDSDTEVCMFYASELEGTTNPPIKEIDINAPIKENIKVFSSKFIYVQCFSKKDSKQEDEDENLNKIIDMKFLFFKYVSLALNRVNPRKLCNAFLIENFSIPVTIKAIDGSNSKTMLFPVLCPFSLDQLNQIVCTAMDEDYRKASSIELFLSFSKDMSPSTERISKIEVLSRALKYSLFNTNISAKKVHFTLSESSLRSVTYENESDSDFDPSIVLYYKVFEKMISVRVYYSNDAINNTLKTQIQMRNGWKVSFIADYLLDFFSSDEKEFTEEEKEEIRRRDFSNYRIVKIKDCKISNTINTNYSPDSTLAIRFERIQKYKNDDNLLGFIPCFYGAFFNKTNYIAAFGSPFFFPVYKDDLETSHELRPNKRYTMVKELFASVINSIKPVNFELYVTNYFGMKLKDKDVSDLKSIMVDKSVVKENKAYDIHVAICMNNMNAASFVDEKKFFNGEIKILV